MVNLQFCTFSPYDDGILDRSKEFAKATMGVQRRVSITGALQTTVLTEVVACTSGKWSEIATKEFAF